MKRSFKARHSPVGPVMRIKAEKNGLASLRTLLVLFLIFLQFVLLFLIHFFLAELFPWYLGLSLALSIITCIRTLSSERSPSSKAVWVFIILIFFYVGYFIYFLADEKFFFRRPKKRYARIFARAEKYKSGQKKAICTDERATEDCVFLQSCGFNSFDGTKAKYFSSGALFFDDVIARMESAEKFIFIEFFIISDGIMFDRVMEVLERKIAQGVEVCVIYDDMGTKRHISFKAKKRMIKAGLKLMSFNRLIPVIDIGMNYRDHRKIIVIDGKTAYTGGVNLADEYTNECRLYGYWKDEGIRLDGYAAEGFTLIFLRQWEYLTRKEVDYSEYIGKSEKKQNDSIYVPFASGLDCKKAAVGKEIYLNVISKAQKKLYIMTPYLVPDDTITTALINKAAGGADVRIFLPDIPDKAVVYRVTLSNAQRLMKHGVKIYLMDNSFIHSKLMLSDYCAVIGSINVDMRSFYQQFESAVYTDDPEILSAVERDFDWTCRESSPLTPKVDTLFNRAVSAVLKIISPLM